MSRQPMAIKNTVQLFMESPAFLSPFIRKAAKPVPVRTSPVNRSGSSVLLLSCSYLFYCSSFILFAIITKGVQMTKDMKRLNRDTSAAMKLPPVARNA